MPMARACPFLGQFAAVFRLFVEGPTSREGRRLNYNGTLRRPRWMYVCMSLTMSLTIDFQPAFHYLAGQ
jgi:hypothetical protein